MPRITTQRYLTDHHWLRRLSLHNPSAFRALSPEQIKTIGRFWPIGGDYPVYELKLHRRIVTAEDPTLPQRAGKALARLRRDQAAGTPATPPPRVRTARPSRSVRVTGLRERKIDIDKIALAFMLMGQRIAEERRTETPNEPDKPDPEVTE